MSFVPNESIVPEFWAVYKDLGKVAGPRDLETLDPAARMICAGLIISALLIRDSIIDAGSTIHDGYMNYGG